MTEIRTITVGDLRKMGPSALDKLPMPVKRGKKRMTWDGYGWVKNGLSDGTEPVEVVDD